MKAVWAYLVLDWRIASRNGLLHVALGLGLVTGLALRFFAPDWLVEREMPIFLLLSLAGATWLYGGALWLYERTHQLTDLQTTLPVSPHPWVVARLTVLCFVSLLEAGLILVLVWLPPLTMLGLGAGALLLALFYTALGTLVALSYRSVTDFLVPTILINIVLSLPIVVAFDLVEAHWLVWVPTLPFWLVLEGMVTPLSLGWALYAWLGSLALTASAITLMARQVQQRRLLWAVAIDPSHSAQTSTL